jgi:predicted nucleic acid-binding protein
MAAGRSVTTITDAEARKGHDLAEVVLMRRATLKAISKGSELRQQQSDVMADFIRIELELADTFCKLSLESHSPEKARQHRVNARRAVDGALDALAKVQIKEEELEGIVTRIEEVKAVLESLEAGGSPHPRC